MNTNTGEVTLLTEAESRALADKISGKASTARRKKRASSIGMGAMKPIDPANLTPRARLQLETTGRTLVSRNSPCPCGSRKRFKRCCMTA